MVGRPEVVVVGSLLLVATVAGAGLAVPAADQASPNVNPATTGPHVTGAPADGPAVEAAGIQETDSTVTRIAVAPNGTATWQVQVRTRLTSDADVAEYEAFQERFRENTSAFLDPFRERMRGVVADASNATGRPMEARQFQAETTIQNVPRRWGVVTYEFQWAHFAAQDGDALAVGDVFRGQFFLTENDTLEVVAPEGFVVTAADPPAAEEEPGTVRWFGRRGFPEDTPAVRFEPLTPSATAGPGATGTASGTDRPGGTGGPGATDESPGTDDNGGTAPPGGTTGPSGSGGSSLPLAGAVLVAGLLAVGAFRYYRQGGSPVGDDSHSDGSGTTTTDGDEPTGPAGTTGDPAETADAGGEEGDGSAGASVDLGPVVTDAERVERLLTEAGGQVRQGDVVDGLDWSKSKTSRVLSDMADEDRIEKLRIGRENVIRFPDDEEGNDAFPDGGDDGE